MGHGVDDAQQRVGEGHAGQALGVVHPIPGGHVAVVAVHQVGGDHLNGVEGQGIGVVAVHGGHIGLDGVGHGIHAGVGSELGGHGLRQIRVHDGHIRGDVEVRQGILDALLIIGNNRERGDLGSGAGGGGNRAEPGLLAQRGEGEGGDEVLERGLRILIEDPHGLGCVDGAAAADGDDPVGLEFAHGLSALHHGLHRGIGLHALKQLHRHAGGLQIVADLVQKAKALHAAAADHDHGTAPLQLLQCIQGTLAVIQVSR